MSEIYLEVIAYSSCMMMVIMAALFIFIAIKEKEWSEALNQVKQTIDSIDTNTNCAYSQVRGVDLALNSFHNDFIERTKPKKVKKHD